MGFESYRLCSPTAPGQGHPISMFKTELTLNPRMSERRGNRSDCYRVQISLGCQHGNRGPGGKGGHVRTVPVPTRVKHGISRILRDPDMRASERLCGRVAFCSICAYERPPPRWHAQNRSRFLPRKVRRRFITHRYSDALLSSRSPIIPAGMCGGRTAHLPITLLFEI